MAPVPAARQFPFFIPGTAGDVFAVHHAPPGEARGGIVFFPPFAEEMNKSRRMVALAARRLAAEGHAVVLVDPFGTGDSAGDFSEARWPVWRDDMAAAVEWLRRSGIQDISFWALRTGALLAADVAAGLGQPLNRLVLWAPVLSGELFVTQFLRLKVASGMLAGGGSVSTRSIRAELAAAGEIEVAGYTLSLPLVEAIERLRLQALPPQSFAHIHWFEVVPEPGKEPGPAVKQVIGAWSAGERLRLAAIAGDAFWSTAEISEAPALIEATVAAFREPGVAS